eukprot:77157_1
MRAKNDNNKEEIFGSLRAYDLRYKRRNKIRFEQYVAETFDKDDTNEPVLQKVDEFKNCKPFSFGFANQKQHKQKRIQSNRKMINNNGKTSFSLNIQIPKYNFTSQWYSSMNYKSTSRSTKSNGKYQQSHAATNVRNNKCNNNVYSSNIVRKQSMPQIVHSVNSGTNKSGKLFRSQETHTKHGRFVSRLNSNQCIHNVNNIS